MPRLAAESNAASAERAQPTQPRRESANRAVARISYGLLVVIALVWASVLFALLLGTTPALAQHRTPRLTVAVPGSSTATNTPTIASPTATPKKDAPTATATSAPPTATATSASGNRSPGAAVQAPTPVTTRIDLSQPTLGTSSGDPTATFTPSNLASNGLAIFTTLGCIVGVIGLLAVGITWLTLVSDGWGPMLKAVVRGNRRGKLRFKRKGVDSRGAARSRQPVSAPKSRSGWR